MNASRVNAAPAHVFFHVATIVVLCCYPAGARGAELQSVDPAHAADQQPWRPYPYAAPKQGRYYPDSEAVKALPQRWRGVAHLPRGFPESFDPPVAATVPDGLGGTIDLSKPPSGKQLRAIKAKISQGHGLQWYFLPHEPRYREGPGLTGDEVLSDIRSGKFVEESGHVTFIYGLYTQNVTTYYNLYRTSGDPYYVDQIVKYAEGLEWLLEHRPEQLLPIDQRDRPPADPVQAIPHEPAALANFWAPVNAARLLLERARERGAGAHDPDVRTAERLLATTVRYVKSQVDAPFSRLYDQAREGRPEPLFVLGPTTRELVETHGLPQRAAQVIEYTPWNQSFFYFAVLAGAARALEDLQAIQGGNAHQETIDLYTHVVRTGLMVFERENDCCICKGRPFVFHMHTPLRDKTAEYRLGHPMFSGEDTAHAGSGAWNLPYIWEAGPQFGCSTALMAGYANAMVELLAHPTSAKNGRPYPRAHFDSPWYIAATGREDKPAPRLGERFVTMAAFAPDLLRAQRRFARRRGRQEELLLWRAGTLYRLWLERRS